MAQIIELSALRAELATIEADENHSTVERIRNRITVARVAFIAASMLATAVLIATSLFN